MKKFSVILIYAVLAMGTFAVYWQVTGFDFVNYDDTDYVYKNLQVLRGLSIEGIGWSFTSGHASNWHPLTWMSLMLDCKLFGPNAGKMHLVNLLFHVLNTLLLFAVLKKITAKVWASAFVAAIFAVHPMHVESVAWIAERKDVLSTFFMMATLWCYAGYVKNGGTLSYIVTLFFFALGLLSKPMLVTLPFLLLLLDYWPLERIEIRKLSKAVFEKVPFFVLAGASCVVTFLVQRAGGSVPDINRFSILSRAANAIESYVRYILKMFWPMDMAVSYPFGNTIVLGVTGICLFVLTAVTILVLLLGKKRKYLPVGWFWFVGTLVPVIGLVQVGEQSYADRYTYIPYIGLFIMIAWGAAEFVCKWRYRKIFLSAAGVVVLAILSMVTYSQAGYWKNSFTLFEHAVQVTKDNYIAYTNLGSAYGTAGNYSKALEACGKAVEINSNSADAYYNLGVTLDKLGKIKESADAFNQTIRIKPKYAQAYNSLGIAYGKSGKMQEAIEAFKKAMGCDGRYGEAYYNMGTIYGYLGQRQEEIKAYKLAIEVRPDYTKARFKLGQAFLETGQRGQAMAEYEILKTLDVEQAGKLFELIEAKAPNNH